MKDWTGNKKSTFVTLGAIGHSQGEREINDYYATEPKAVELILELEKFSKNIWEPACGEGHISEVFKKCGFNVFSTDLINRGYGNAFVDFSKINEKVDCDIITNPPYKYAKEFVEHALNLLTPNHKIAMFLKIQFLEGKGRRELFKRFPPNRVYVSSSRLKCAINGDFEKIGSSATVYCWYIWEYGYKGETVIKWFN